MSQQCITLIPFGYFEKSFLDRLVKEVSSEFNLTARVKDGLIDLSDFYDPVRRQYSGDRLLKEVETKYSNDLSKTIGLFNVDLFVPILTYIFGQAYLGGRTGIISLYRLSNERYGMTADEEVFVNRTIKEVVHELGHTFGLIHCHTPACVMQSSTYVEDLDQKSYKLCLKCRSELAYLEPL